MPRASRKLIGLNRREGVNEGERIINTKSGERQEGQLASCRTL